MAEPNPSGAERQGQGKAIQGQGKAIRATLDRPPLAFDEVSDELEPAVHALEQGNHQLARSLARDLVDSEDGQVAEGASQVLAASRPDRLALLTAALTLMFLLVVGGRAVSPHEMVRGARTLLGAIGAGDEAAARSSFTEAGWSKAGGQRLFHQFVHQRGRAFELSDRARERSFVLVDFPQASAVTGGGLSTRRYLVFSEGTIEAVRKNVPPKAVP